MHIHPHHPLYTSTSSSIYIHTTHYTHPHHPLHTSKPPTTSTPSPASTSTPVTAYTSTPSTTSTPTPPPTYTSTQVTTSTSTPVTAYTSTPSTTSTPTPPLHTHPHHPLHTGHTTAACHLPVPYQTCKCVHCVQILHHRTKLHWRDTGGLANYRRPS